MSKRSTQFVRAVAATFAFAWAGDALAAMPAEIHLVFWSGNTTDKADLDALFGCLSGSSTFATTWAAQFGLSSVAFASSTVLQAAAPASVDYQSNLETFMKSAFTQGLLPPPKPGVANEYILYWPPGTSVTASGNGQTATLCQGFGSPCGVHDSFSYGSIQYDVGSVPLSCSACPGLAGETAIGEHEAAEGIADFGQAALGNSNPFEVGDDCEGSQFDYTQLACCGKTYTVQMLSGMSSAGQQTSCQTISASGSSCACVAPGAACSSAVGCCAGTTCDPSAKTCEVEVVDAGGSGSSSGGSSGSSGGSGSGSGSGSGGGSGSGSSGGSSSGSGSSGSGSSGSSGSGSSSGGSSSSGSSSSGGAGGGSSSSSGGRGVDAGVGSVADGGSDAASDGFTPSAGPAGCGCRLAPAEGRRDALAAALGAAVALAFRRRRRRAAGAP